MQLKQSGEYIYIDKERFPIQLIEFISAGDELILRDKTTLEELALDSFQDVVDDSGDGFATIGDALSYANGLLSTSNSSGGIVITKHVYTTTSTSNINASSSNNVVPITTQSQGDSSLMSLSSNTFTVQQDCMVDINAKLVVNAYNNSAQRYQGDMKVMKNGVVIDSGNVDNYLRDASAQDDTALRAIVFKESFSAGDTIQFFVDRKAIYTAAYVTPAGTKFEIITYT